MLSAFRLPARAGMARLRKQAEWLERGYPSAATGLPEGLKMFTLYRWGLPPSRCLASTNAIENLHSSVRLCTRRVGRWGGGEMKMVLRWAAAALLVTGQKFRRIMGNRDLWMLKVSLDQKGILAQQKVA